MSTRKREKHTIPGVIKRQQLKALGKRVREILRGKSLTQAELAERSNLSTNYIGKIERGESQATLDALLSIALALKTNPSTLFVHLDRAPSKEEIKRRIGELLENL
jgi:transcriptional regulator with XRE-family HTH domain